MKRVIATIAALALLVLPSMPANAAAGGDATIQGTLVNGTTNEPIAGESVSLSQANVQTQQPNENMDQATTDARGRFEFSSVPSGDQYMYDVSVNYQDADYLSKALTPKAGETVSVKLTAYDSSESPKNMSVSSWIVYLDKDPKGIAVEQSVTYVNGGNTTYQGVAMPGSKDHLSVELPVATTAVENSQQTDGVFAQCCSGVVGGTFGFTAPLVPGSSEGILRYVSTSPVSLSFPAQFPTTNFTMYVAPEITVTPDGLTQAGTESLPGGGPSPSPIVYTKYTASNLAAGQTVGASATMAADKPPTLALILLALAGLAALFVVVVRLRLDAQKPKPSGGPRKATPSQPVRRKPSKPKQPSRSERHSEAEVDADLLIAEIAALDVSFDQGLIQEDDYKKIRAARKAQLLDARKEDDGG